MKALVRPAMVAALQHEASERDWHSPLSAMSPLRQLAQLGWVEIRGNVSRGRRVRVSVTGRIALAALVSSAKASA